MPLFASVNFDFNILSMYGKCKKLYTIDQSKTIGGKTLIVKVNKLII